MSARPRFSPARRALARIGLFGVLLAMSAAPRAVAAPFAYVTDILASQVWVVDLGTQSVVTTIPVGFLPNRSVYSSTLGLLYVVCQEGYGNDSRVFIINTATNGVVGTVTVGKNAGNLALNPDQTLLFVAAGDPRPNYHKHVLWVIDTATGTVKGTIDPGGGGNVPAFDPSTGRLWVGLYNNGVPGVVTVKETTRNFATLADITPLGGIPIDFAFDPAKFLVYVVDESNSVKVIHTRAMALVRSVPIGVGLHAPNGNDYNFVPSYTLLNASRTSLYVLNSPVNTGCVDTGCPNRISVIDTSSFTEVQQISFGTFETESHANGMALDPSGASLYVARIIECGPFTGCGAITVIDTATNQPVSTIDLGPGYAGSITVTPGPPNRLRCPTGYLIEKPDSIYSAAGGVVTDQKTGLAWKQCSEGQSGASCSGTATPMSWSAALTAAAGSSFGGFSDWRLPNVKELESLLEYGCFSPSINVNVFPATRSAKYWSSTTGSDYFGYAWYVDFSGAINANYNGDKSSSNYVRLVRGGRVLDAFDRTTGSSPAPFFFSSQTGVPPNSAVISNTIAVSGLVNPTGIRVTGGSNAAYSIGGGPFVSTPGIVRNGDTVSVRQTSSTLGSTLTSVTLTIGATAGLFNVTTAAGSFSPPTMLAISSVNGGSHPKASVDFAAVPFPVVVESRDGGGAPQNAVADTPVTLSLSAGTGVLAGTLTCTIAAGTSSCGVSAATYSKAEPGVVLTATRTSGDALAPGSSLPFTVDPSGLRLVFVQAPATTAPGQPIAPSVTVRLVDGFGTPVAAPLPVTMSLSSGTGVLSGTVAGTADTQGLASFTNLSIDLAGSKQLTASSPGIISAVSGAFLIAASTSPAQVLFVQPPSTTSSGLPILPGVRVQLANGAGGAVAWSGVTVTLSLSSGSGSLAGTLSRPTDSSGIATFSGLSIAATGLKQLTAASSGLTSAVSPSFSITTAGAVASAAIAVDGSGNGILEPGESMAVSPSWHNATGAPISLTGVATSFGGPGGATYSIADAAASYGSVAGGGTASCTTAADCYTVLLSNPGVRPVLHWDALFSESVSSGDAKTWVLHVGKSFTDVSPSSGQYRFIETMLHKGITAGCGGTNFCPGATVTRAQMSVFLLVAKDGSSYVPPAATGIFADVPASNGFAKWIEELFHRGVTAGCGGGNYCPTGPVTRAQMAVFLLVTKDGSSYVPPPATGIFPDVPVTSGFAKWVEELFHRGITAGCGGGNYCPNAGVTRGQMAVFLSTSFALGLYGP